VWGRDLRFLSFSSLAHVPLGFDFVFWNQFSGVGICSLFSLLTHVPLVFFDLVFWNQFECEVRICAPFPSSTCVFPWVFFLCFLNQFSVGSGSARSLSFSSLACSLGFGLFLESV
jgi:hypothetical protein